MNYRQCKKYYKYFRGTCKCDDICYLFTAHTDVKDYVIVKWYTSQKELRKKFRELTK